MWKSLFDNLALMQDGIGTITDDGIAPYSGKDGWHYYKKSNHGITDVYVSYGLADDENYFTGMGVRKNINTMKRDAKEKFWPVWFHLTDPKVIGDSFSAVTMTIFWPYVYSENALPETPISFSGVYVNVGDRMSWQQGWFMWPNDVTTVADSNDMNFDPLCNKCLDDPLIKCQFSSMDNEDMRYRFLVGDDIPF